MDHSDQKSCIQQFSEGTKPKSEQGVLQPFNEATALYDIQMKTSDKEAYGGRHITRNSFLP